MTLLYLVMRLSNLMPRNSKVFFGARLRINVLDNVHPFRFFITEVSPYIHGKGERTKGFPSKGMNVT
jgi:hypothetical protein